MPNDDDTIPSAEPPTAPMSAASAHRFRAIVDAQFDFIWRSLRGLGVPDGAVDDAAQHVFLIAARKLDAIAAGSERAFLCSTALGVAANARRSRARSPEVHDDDALATHPDQAPGPEELTAQKRARLLLDRALQALPVELRTVFVLFELEEMSSAEIAALLAIPQGTAASRLRRAREEFRAILTRLAATSSPTPRGAR